ncbi:C2 domain-containing protein At1g63220-like isoform X2 [Papaver somniferum]|uniref:C2 domain-containing protein At1g63220-like isoform X2 n=1 Tax=Papaver somniferum TaxID=3469 RepID=UPI000E70061F|nr:C2 domain-containing protein At1g63220-like isoform X2 [Papaver somniferum]
MPQGILHVILISAKGLKNTDFLSNMDPYAVLTCRTQEKKSGVASGRGSEPEWNQSFIFTISEGSSELLIKLWDNDTGRKDDVIGVATIPLEPVFEGGSVPEGIYNVVKDEEYCGEIKVSLLFSPDEESRGEDEET